LAWNHLRGFHNNSSDLTNLKPRTSELTEQNLSLTGQQTSGKTIVGRVRAERHHFEH